MNKNVVRCWWTDEESTRAEAIEDGWRFIEGGKHIVCQKCAKFPEFVKLTLATEETIDEFYEEWGLEFVEDLDVEVTEEQLIEEGWYLDIYGELFTYDPSWERIRVKMATSLDDTPIVAFKDSSGDVYMWYESGC